MTATDELRRLLDERGVEYDGKTYEGATFWNDDTNIAVASEGYGGKLWVSQSLTPAQAVEATLGRGTCHECAGMEDVFECSECGMRYEGWALKRWARYCPNCGRKVVDA